MSATTPWEPTIATADSDPQLALLRQVPYLAVLPPEALAALRRRMQLKRWYDGAIVVGQDEPANALHVVLSGRARVVLFGESGREMTLAELEPGATFGEMSLLDGRPRASNVLAVSDLTLLSLGRRAFEELLQRHPEVSAALLPHLAGRLRRTTEAVRSLALHDVSTRLLRTLVELGEERGEPMDDGVLIRRRPTQQELANRVGTCRETVSRALTAMTRKGLLACHGRSVFLSRDVVDRLEEAA